ncbi:MAG TPA: hypothetical protein VFH83_12530, partial [Spirochaetia bacterium]|nr:hypothetical protein [Spirochaetia bacterium]
GAWHEVRVSQSDSTVKIDGTAIGASAASVSTDPGYGELSLFQFDVTGPSGSPPPPSGLLYLDEVYLTDPSGSFGAALVGTFAASYPGPIVALGRIPILSNLDLRQDLSMQTAGFAPLYGVPSGTDEIVSRTQAAADVLFARLAVDIRLLEAAGSLQAAGGHKITLPAGGLPLSLSDSFDLSGSGGFSREDNLTLGLGWPVSAVVDSAASVDDLTGVLQQSWSAAATANLGLAASAALQLSQAVGGYPLPALSYFDRWVRELALLEPYQGGADLQRGGKLDLKVSLPAAPLGFNGEVEADMAGTDYDAAGFTQQSDALLSLGLSLRLGEGTPNDTTLSLGYQRSLALTTTPGPGPRFAAEGEELARLLALQTYLWEAIPLQEIFADTTAVVAPDWLSVTKAIYVPSLDLSLQRGYGSRLLDLIVPDSVDLSLRQDVRREADLSSAIVTIAPKVSTHAINLFGRLGAFPLVPWMDTDEYSLSVSGTAQAAPLTPLVVTTLSAEGYVAAKAQGGAEVTLVETFKRDQTTSIDLSNDTQALLSWNYAPEGGIPIPLVPVELSSTVSLANQEKVEVTVAYNDTSSYHPFTLTLGHATSLVFPGHGTIKASLDVGADVENLLQEGVAWRLAVRAALEAKLTF